MMLRNLFRAFFLLFAFSIFILEFPGIKDLSRNPYSGVETRNLVVQNVDSQGPNVEKGIRFGDEIHAIDGVAIRNFNHFRYLISSNQDLKPQRYTLLRGSKRVQVDVEYSSPPSRIINRKFKFLLVAFTFLMLGIFVYSRRSDLIGALFSLNCTVIAFLLTDRPIVSSPFLHLFGELFHDAVFLVFPAVFMNFFFVFPDRYLPDGTPKDAGKMAKIYVVPLVIFAIDCYLVLKHFFFSPASSVTVRAFLGFSTIYMAVYLLTSLFIFVRTYYQSPAAQKLRLRIVIAGTIVGTIPFLFTMVLRQVSPGTTSNMLDLLSAVSLGFIAVSFAYSILKHGAIELNIVIKKSLVYAVLTGGIIAIYYTLVNVLGDYLTSEFKLSRSVFSILSVLIIAIIFSPARSFFQNIIDRFFYVGDYVYKQEVVEFNRLLSGKITKNEILSAFFDVLERLLKVSYVAIYLKNDKGSLNLERTSGDASFCPQEFPSGSFLETYLSKRSKTLLLEYTDREWQIKILDEASKNFLETTGAKVCLPLATHESFLGMILLGPKRSSRIYTRSDADLLETFAEHLGLVIENAELHEATIEKERLKNEVMLARDIQISLLPDSPPKIEGFNIFGMMKSSSEVGGDYYDYFSLGDRKIAVVQADVSGSGIPAAMLVFSLQAVFKNLAIRERLSPAELVNELNSYLCVNAKPDQFATFFYGILDAKRAIFTFSNAGQHPALLVKEDYVDRLGEGGILLGVDNNHVYEEGSVRLDPGDLLCLYTDGLVEQTNPLGEEFGAERLIEFLTANKNISISAIAELLFANILAYGEGKQDDDLSCIILSCKMS